MTKKQKQARLEALALMVERAYNVDCKIGYWSNNNTHMFIEFGTSNNPKRFQINPNGTLDYHIGYLEAMLDISDLQEKIKKLEQNPNETDYYTLEQTEQEQ